MQISFFIGAGILLAAGLLVALRAFGVFGQRKVVTGFRGRARGIIFGKSQPFMVDYSSLPQEGHVAVFGGSGLGKTSAVIIPTLRSCVEDGTFYVVDISGDISSNVDVTNKIEYRPEDPASIPYSVFDAIDNCGGGQAEQYELLEQLAFILMPDRPGQSDAAEFFNIEGRKILTAALVCYYGLGLDFIPICEKVTESSWRDLLNDIAAQDNPKANQYIRAFAGANDQNNAGCKQSVDRAIKLFATNDIVKKTIRRRLRSEPFYAPRVLEQYNAFVVVDESKLKLYAPLLQLVTAQTLEYFSARKTAQAHTILFCLDEFASLGKMDILTATRRFRKRRVRVMMCTQSLADIDLVYGPAERRAMMENFAFKVVLGADDTDTQEYFSKLIGEKPEKKPLFPLLGSSNSQGGTNSHTYMVPIIPPAHLGRLKNRLVLLSPDGHKLLRKNFYYKRF